jgi:hypothetical protein
MKSLDRQIITTATHPLRRLISQHVETRPQTTAAPEKDTWKQSNQSASRIKVHLSLIAREGAIRDRNEDFIVAAGEK